MEESSDAQVKTSNEILSELFGAFNAEPPNVIDKSKGQSAGDNSDSSEKPKKNKHKKSKKKYKSKSKKHRKRHSHHDSCEEYENGSVKKKKKKQKEKNCKKGNELMSPSNDNVEPSENQPPDGTVNNTRGVGVLNNIPNNTDNNQNSHERVALPNPPSHGTNAEQNKGKKSVYLSRVLDVFEAETVEQGERQRKGKIQIRNLKFSSVYQETVKAVEEKQKKEKERKDDIEEGELSDTTESDHQQEYPEVKQISTQRRFYSGYHYRSFINYRYQVMRMNTKALSHMSRSRSSSRSTLYSPTRESKRGYYLYPSYSRETRVYRRYESRSRSRDYYPTYYTAYSPNWEHKRLSRKRSLSPKRSSHYGLKDKHHSPSDQSDGKSKHKHHSPSDRSDGKSKHKRRSPSGESHGKSRHRHRSSSVRSDGKSRHKHRCHSDESDRKSKHRHRYRSDESDRKSRHRHRCHSNQSDRKSRHRHRCHSARSDGKSKHRHRSLSDQSDGRSKRRHRSRSGHSDGRSRNKRIKLDSSRRSGSRNHTKTNSRARSSSVEKIDKEKLLAIARKNALKLIDAGMVPGSEKLKAIKAGGKTVNELTEYCKKLSKKEALGQEMSDSESESSYGRDKLFHHPFQVREKPGSIVMNIKNSVPLPLKSNRGRSPEQTNQLRMQYPVSSGTSHRRTEKERISPNRDETFKKRATGSDSETKPQGDSTRSDTQNKPDANNRSVYDWHSDSDEPKQDISVIVSKRLDAMRRLQENPNDSRARDEMNSALREMQTWSNSKEGISAGSSAIKALSQSEFNLRANDWAKRTQLMAEIPVTGMGKTLLQKMGWQPGEGLGKNKEGTLEPLKLELKTDKKGLIASDECKVRKKQNRPRPFFPRRPETKHPVSLLNELCGRRKYGIPHFELCSEYGPDHKKNFIFKVTVNGRDYTPEIASPTKKQAKAEAATVCLKDLGIL